MCSCVFVMPILHELKPLQWVDVTVSIHSLVALYQVAPSSSVLQALHAERFQSLFVWKTSEIRNHPCSASLNFLKLVYGLSLHRVPCRRICLEQWPDIHLVQFTKSLTVPEGRSPSELRQNYVSFPGDFSDMFRWVNIVGDVNPQIKKIFFPSFRWFYDF